MLTESAHETSTTLIAEPPVHDRVSVDEDRRYGSRLPSSVPIKLSVLGWNECQSCTTVDLSEGGLYVRLPRTCGLSVGQRCEVEFGGPADAHELSGVAGEIRYATVVRTDALPSSSGDQIGAGLRFDQPLFL